MGCGASSRRYEDSGAVAVEPATTSGEQNVFGLSETGTVEPPSPSLLRRTVDFNTDVVVHTGSDGRQQTSLKALNGQDGDKSGDGIVSIISGKSQESAGGSRVGPSNSVINTSKVLSYLKGRQESNASGTSSDTSAYHVSMPFISKHGHTLSSFFSKSGDIQEYKPHVDFLRTVSSPTTSLDMYVDTIIKEAVRAVDADRCSVFFVDDVRKEVWCVGSLDMESFSMPWDQGIVGLVAHGGKLLNLADVHTHTAFDSTVETLTGYAVHSMLSLPIKHMTDDSRTIGVLQVLNKQKNHRGRTGAQKHAHPVFSEEDVIEMQKMSMLMSDSFHRQRWRALERYHSLGDREAMSVILEHTRSTVYVQRKAGDSGGHHVTSSSSQSGSTGASGALQLELDAFTWPASTPPSLSPSLCSLQFNALAHPADYLIDRVPDIMEHADCVDSCNIEPHCLRSWARAVRHLYRDNPFHSWFHAFSVYSMCYYQLFTSSVTGHLKNIDVFGLLMAALCHDINHPGVTNSFLVGTEDELALRYNDVSVLENYHASCASELLRGDATGIAAGMKRASQQRLRKTMIKCILDTDMAHHNELCQKIQSGQLNGISAKEEMSIDLRQLLLSSFIHSSDLSAQVLPWPVAAQWEERISQEFVAQAAKEVEAGLSPAPFMQFSIDDIKQRGKLQKNFVDFVLTPLWAPFSDMYVEFRPCYENLIINRGKYDHRAVHGADADEHEDFDGLVREAEDLMSLSVAAAV